MAADPESSPRAPGIALSLLALGLLSIALLRHVQAVRNLGGFGLQARDVLLLAVGVALAALLLDLLDRGRRQAMAPGALAAVAAAVVVLALLPWATGDPQSLGYGHMGADGFQGAYSSDLFIDFGPELQLATGVVVIAALGLLPVLGWRLMSGRTRRSRLSRPLRAALVLVCAGTALLVLRDLERAVALLDLVRGHAQQLGLAEALHVVAGLWVLVALALSAKVLLQPRDQVPRAAVVVPVAAAAGWLWLLVDQAPRHACCFSYAPLDSYRPPALAPDLWLLAGCVAVGIALPVAAQLLRSRTSASTPPG